MTGNTERPTASQRLWAFGAGLLAGVTGLALYRFLQDEPGLDARVVRSLTRGAEVPPTVIVPGLLGSSLDRPDGSRVWLDLANAIGWHDLALHVSVPPAAAGDGLVPGPVIGAGGLFPRLFGFTEYADLIELLDRAGFRLLDADVAAPLGYLVATYDWRLDLLAAVRRLDATLEMLAEARDDSGGRFNVIGHSMGALVARYYLRYGTAEPGGPVTWAGARRIHQMMLVAPPNAGSISSLDAILNGSRVGLSYGTLSALVVARMPSIYQLLPPREAATLVDAQGETVDADLLDSATWERFGWGPYAPRGRRKTDSEDAAAPEEEREYLAALLGRARFMQAALAQPAATPCPCPVTILGGDCLPTLGRAIVGGRRGSSPRFEPSTSIESEVMLEEGDARVTRASVLAAHLPAAAASPMGCGLPEVGQVFFGAADHHGIYAEATFQSLILRHLRGRHSARPLHSAGAPTSACRTAGRRGAS
jgi:pimeloyl-ACP methyl ester carboxylesterase